MPEQSNYLLEILNKIVTCQDTHTPIDNAGYHKEKRSCLPVT